MLLQVSQASGAVVPSIRDGSDQTVYGLGWKAKVHTIFVQESRGPGSSHVCKPTLPKFYRKVSFKILAPFL
jgi:hypothetical protein